MNRVLANLREGCHREGRVWAMMLDLSVGRDATSKMVMDDWKFLADPGQAGDLHVRDESSRVFLGLIDRPEDR